MWHRMYYIFIVLCMCLIFPASLCAFHFCRRKYFDRFWKAALWAAALSLFSWAFMVLSILSPYWLGWHVLRGPEIAMALVMGWAYIWFTSAPVFVLYLLYLYFAGREK